MRVLTFRFVPGDAQLAATWRSTSHSMYLASVKSPTVGFLKEVEERCSPLLTLGCLAGFRRQAALFLKLDEMLLNQLLAGAAALRQSARQRSSHRPAARRRVPAGLQLRRQREQG